MDVTGMNNLFSLIALLFGAYCFYAWYQLKDGTIPEKFALLSRDLPVAKCLDQEYYTQYMRPRLMIFAVVTFLSGIIGLADQRTGMLATLLGDNAFWARLLLTSVIPFAAVIWFGWCVTKIQKELW